MKRNKSKLKRAQEDNPNRESKYARKVRMHGFGASTMHKTRTVTLPNGHQYKAYVEV